MREILDMVLRRAALDVRTVGTVEEARAADAIAADLILLDLHLNEKTDSSLQTNSLHPGNRFQLWLLAAVFQRRRFRSASESPVVPASSPSLSIPGRLRQKSLDI